MRPFCWSCSLSFSGHTILSLVITLSWCQGPKAWDARSHQLRWCHLSTQTVPGTWEKLRQYLLNELTSPCTIPNLIFEKYVLSGGGRQILY